MSDCSYCHNTILPKEMANTGLFGKPVCNSKDCITKANTELQAATDAAMSPKDKVISYLAREGFKEQGMTKGLFILDGETQIAVDINKLSDEFPGALVMGVYAGGNILESGHGVNRLESVIVSHRQNIISILKSKPVQKAKEQPAPTLKDAEKHLEGRVEALPETKDLLKKKEEPKAQPKPAEELEPTKDYKGDVGWEKPPTKIIHKPGTMIPARMTAPQGNYIKGLVPMMKEIGKIKIGRKGEKKTGTGYRLPEKFDHFEIVSVMRDDKGNLIPDPVMKELDENPKELDIFLLYNDETLNFTTRYNEYKGGKCQCSGDGVKARLNNGDEIECNPETCKVFKEKRCKPNGILSVILTKSPRLGGVYKFRTTSYNSIRSILSSLFFLKSLTGGVLAMIPLKLTVSPMTVQPKDSMTAQTIYVVNVEFAGTVQQLLEKTVEVSKYQSMMRSNIKQLEATARASLAIPETEEESKEIQAEFYPEKPEEAKS